MTDEEKTALEGQGWIFSEGYCHHISPNDVEGWRRIENDPRINMALRELRGALGDTSTVI